MELDISRTTGDGVVEDNEGVAGEARRAAKEIPAAGINYQFIAGPATVQQIGGSTSTTTLPNATHLACTRYNHQMDSFPQQLAKVLANFGKLSTFVAHLVIAFQTLRFAVWLPVIRSIPVGLQPQCATLPRPETLKLLRTDVI